MTEYIDKQKSIRAINQYCNESDNGPLALYTGIQIAQRIIFEQPAADVVEVVRCRECKHYSHNGSWCDIFSKFIDDDGNPYEPSESPNWIVFGDDDYCSHGERRKEDKQ